VEVLGLIAVVEEVPPVAFVPYHNKLDPVLAVTLMVSELALLQ
jgi:hypothetical protein